MAGEEALDVAREAAREVGRRLTDRIKSAAHDAKAQFSATDVARVEYAAEMLGVLGARQLGGEPGLDVEIAGHRSVLSGYAFVAASVAREETLDFARLAAEDVGLVAIAAAKTLARLYGVPLP